MASNVSNLLKEKIVTPVANSVAAQVDNKVKNGIILRKFIGVQLGESNTGCQLVKIDLNKINVKDPSYEFTLYIKAFSQKGLFNFIVNVNKTDSLQVDVKCEVKNSDSNNGESIGYYDVDTVGNTITISLLKAFVVNTSINECKFVSTKDTLNISDLDIDWSDTGNVKTSTSINIRYNQTSIYEYDEYFYTYKPDFADGEMHQIAKFDFSEILNKTLTKNKNFDIIIDIIYHSIGEFHICFDLTWMRNLNTINMIHGAYEKIPSQSSMEGRNFDELFKFCKKDNTTLLLLINPPAMYISGGKFVIRRIEVHRADADIESDLVKIDLTPEKLVNSDGSLVIGSIKKHTIDFTKVFTPSDSDNAVTCNGVVPHPTTSEADNKYLLGADAKWHPRKIMNDSFIDLEPDDAIKGLNIEDGTKAVSFVTFDFNNIVTKLTELSKNSTQIHFEMELETTGNTSIDYHINGSFMVNKSGLIPTTVFTSPLTKNSNTIGYLENPSALYSEIIDTPGFYIMDPSLKTVTFALYTVLANSTVRIKDFYIHVDESVISLEDLTIEWKLLAIDKPEWVVLRVQKFINGSLIPPTRIFEQMNIETPIDEADSFTLEKERVKNNGLVPAPGKYEVDNGYVLGADAKWHPRKAGNEYIANLKPTEEIKGLSETDTTKGISFVTFDFNTLSQKVVEAAPSTTQDFMINMKVLTYDLGIITISTKLGVTTAGLVACNGVLSDRGMGSRSVSFSTTYSGKLGAVTSPGFFVNDKDTKIFKIALYTPIAIDGVKIIDVVVTSYSDIIDESDIVFTWELGILEKKPYKPLTSNIIYPRIDLDRELVFDQMNIETPISETDEDTLFAEQIKHNGLVPAPGKYEVNNGYYLKADGSWDLPKRGNNNSVSVVTPSEEMTSQVSSTVGITFATFDYSKIIESLSLAVNTGSGFEGILNINTKLFGEILINFSVTLFNLNGTINKGATAYANVGTKSAVHINQISIIQNTYGADIKTPVFIYTDSVNNICKIGLYGTASKSPVIIKDCTLNQTYTDFDVNDITITWEPTTITISEETTNDASLFTNMDWSKTFTPMTNMTDPDGSYSENNIRRWKLQNNGLVPAPAKYEADQGYVLCADGSWKKVDGNTSFTPVPITLDSTKYQEAYETQSNPDSSKKTILFMNIDLSDFVITGSDVAKIELSLYSAIYGRSTLVIDTMINAISNQYCVSEDANGSGYYLDYMLSVLQKNPSFTGKDGVSIESFYTFMIDGDIIRIGISPIIFSLYTGTVPPYAVIVIEDCKFIRQSVTSNSVTTEMGNISINYDQTTNTLSNIYGANRKGWVAKNIVFSDYSDADPRDFQSLHNGLVPAPTREEARENKFLKADGSWSAPSVDITSITTNPEDEGKILKAHNGSAIWASLINGEEVSY